MKKLMIAVAGVVCAFALNAATYDWQVKITNAYTADGYNANTMVYLVDAATWEAADLTKGTSLFTSDFYADSTTFAAASGKTDGSKTYQTIKTGTTKGSRAIVATDEAVPVGTTWDVYYVMVKDDGTGSPTYFAHADTLTARASTGEAATSPNYSFASSTVSYASFPSSPVPEPTSGLLMVLGVAGLALRRRRA